MGAVVEIHSLQKSPELNGVRGEVVKSQDLSTGRCEVKTATGKDLALKPVNLRLIRAPTGPAPEPAAVKYEGHLATLLRFRDDWWQYNQSEMWDVEVLATSRGGQQIDALTLDAKYLKVLQIFPTQILLSRALLPSLCPRLCSRSLARARSITRSSHGKECGQPVLTPQDAALVGLCHCLKSLFWWLECRIPVHSAQLMSPARDCG